jgi:hypothetical protein
MVVYLSKPMIMRINHMCKGKRKLWLQGTDDVLVVRLHMVGKEWKFRLLTTWHPSLHFIISFLSLDPSLSYVYCYLLFSLFFFFHSFIFLLSFIHIYFFLSFFLSFPYSYFSLYFSLSWQLLKALNSSLSHMHTIWNFN